MEGTMSANSYPGQGDEQMPAPSTRGEVDSAALVLGQGLIGMGHELVAAAKGEHADPVLLAKFRRIVLEVGDMMSRARAGAEAQAQQAQTIEPQTGVDNGSTMSTVRDYYGQGAGNQP
jgi:hypothetical protein